MPDIEIDLLAIKIVHLTGLNIGRADSEPRLTSVYQIKIDQITQCAPQFVGGVVAGIVWPEWHMRAEKSHWVRLKEIGNATHDGAHRAQGRKHACKR